MIIPMKYTWKTEGNTSVLLINDRAIAHVYCPGFYVDYDGYCYGCLIMGRTHIGDLQSQNLEGAQRETIDIVIQLYKKHIKDMKMLISECESVISTLGKGIDI